MSKNNKIKNKEKTESQVLRCKVKPSSPEEVVINYLSMRWRARKSKTTIQDIFDLAPNKFKTLEALSKYLNNLLNYKYISELNGSYQITELGYKVPYIIAQHRRAKNSKNTESD